MVGVAQPLFYRVLDIASLVLGLLPGSLAVVAVILVGVEGQKGGNQDRKNYYDCRSHRIGGISARCTISIRLRIKKKLTIGNAAQPRGAPLLDPPLLLKIFTGRPGEYGFCSGSCSSHGPR